MISIPVRFLPIVLLLAGLLAGPGLQRPAEAALPGWLTAHHRVLYADAILIARCTQAGESDLFNGAPHDLAVERVLLNRTNEASFDGWQVRDVIPSSSSLGQRLPLPQGEPVLLFVNLREKKQLSLLTCCMNAAVPLDGEEPIGEMLTPYYDVAETRPGEVADRIEALIAEFQTYEFLVEAYHNAIGSMHPFCYSDKRPLLELLLAMEDPRLDAFCWRELDDPETPENCKELLRKYLGQ